MKLHLETKLFNQAIQFTADIMNIPAIYVEKDYWITYALYTIFHSHIAQEVVFKGGTSLSKCYQLIDRFSEDIDLVILKNENDNANQLKRKLKVISHIVGEVLPEITVEDTIRNSKKIFYFLTLIMVSYIFREYFIL
ncbi:nucleotidyl transferase AbiEii/AbiGii toxin family protein [Pasteurella skyensis]|uniref:Nucleotidyl transferase AbiEii/AbiGii toxin family protein n=1 Tax=Phocoenobacter skyensis TaxID=97481 RepID=A0AAJ6NBC0_9PAST|nr:nucleotidyl transferase AbiEii/AbiGii toxin family protein [Pasteurella skyensis]MDP8163406.1 nucleotidyl transferase AbiEii/AbiGii toxin family protein [Pasteurella skyensis]MDP8173648.1 nucleotidyl transferase AbiEii/AbiGii toxin family protein [Pasteurella skyensis]MDP8179814.1 nucleotidyl transferase AbiEii/AbiGii toxin family protein [Pasteurella skyensis]MDP8183928.1 nucleotidyl transferase AbiEii/AbiGii toxin family protein [Pasteurella skyensis]MDP8190122.1 nucleotidyl transferase A